MELPCQAFGSPPPELTWQKDGRALQEFGTWGIFTPEGALRIPQALLSDIGIYTCVATNVAGREEAEITLHVQGDLSTRHEVG